MICTWEILEGEYWWGGCADEGTLQPYGKETSLSFDYRVTCFNQGMPLYISNKGRYIWSEDAFAISFEKGRITVESDLPITLTESGSTLRDAYLAAKEAHFPFGGKVPEKAFFTTAQYNTWMEYTYFPDQKKVLEYAHAIIEHDFIPGVLIIDEGWHRPYGDWTFDPEKFPDPKAMIEQLHELGFKVMLWVVPYVTCSGLKYVSAIRQDLHMGAKGNMFLRTEDGSVALTEWWNGISAILDFTDPENCQYLDNQLRVLVEEYGVDGFKFDGGSKMSYSNIRLRNGQFRGTQDGTYSPLKQNIAWNDFGTRYPFHEYKDTYKGGGKPVIQRLRDRGHRWDGDGINTIIPNALVQGLMGYPFICPDMIGGGEWSYNVRPGFTVDEELFVRMAQVSVFFPMMQFSWAPWRVLSKEACDIVANCGKMHSQMSEEIMAVIEEAAVSGEPVVRSMEYAYPGSGYEKVTDQFLCGDKILVCPVVTKGTFEKDVIIPEGKWQDELGNVYGKGIHRIQTPLDRLAYFRKI